jgi:hypothetical protein
MPEFLGRPVATREEYHFTKGELSRATMTIYGIMKSANSSLLIIDSWVDESIYKLIQSLDQSIAFKIITNESKLKPIFIDITSKLHKEGWDLIVKSSPSFHDRYLVIDDEYIWHLGASVKDAGVRDFTINKIKDTQEKGRIKASYNNVWLDSVTLFDGSEYSVAEYRVDLQFPTYIQNSDEDIAKSKAKTLLEKWINKVEKRLDVNIRVISTGPERIEGLLIISGHVRLELTWKDRGFDGSSYFIASDINIRTSDKAALNRVIK